MNQVASTPSEFVAERIAGMEADELAEWFECLDDISLRHGGEQVRQLLQALQDHARSLGISRTAALNTPYINTITVDDQLDYPGDAAVEQSSVYLDDAVDAIVRAVDRRQKLEPATPILIGESRPPSCEELQESIGRAIHHEEWSTIYVPPMIAKTGAKVMDKMSSGDTFIKPFMVDLADDHYSTWDPIFGEQSNKVLQSKVAKELYRFIGIHDAAMDCWHT